MKAPFALKQHFFKTFEHSLTPVSPLIPAERLLELHRAADLSALRDALAAWLGSELPWFESIVFLKDPNANEFEFDASRASSNPPGFSVVWLKSHLARHPSLFQKLRKGELVAITSTHASATPRPAEGSQSGIILLPVTHQSLLIGVFGVLSTIDGPEPTADDMEAAQGGASEVAPLLGRMLETERLRAENAGLRARVEKLAAVEASALHCMERNTQLEGLRQMRAHLHINLAHELRTPLAAVRGYARMVLEGRGGEVTSQQREYLAIVNENTERMIHLVSWMRRVFDIGEHEMRLEVVDFLGVWSKCFSKHQEALLKKSIEVALTISGKSFTGLADKNQISRIFDQLLSAAIRFSDPSAKLSVTFSHGGEQETTVTIAGITHEIPGEPSDQSDRAISNVYDAVGVHGGRFLIKRTPEDGTILMATLPAIRHEAH